MESIKDFKFRYHKFNKLKNRKYVSMPELQQEEIDQVVNKMRAVSSCENISEIIPIVKYKAELESYRKKTMQERLDETSPYNLFFNVMEIAPETYKQSNSIKFTDLLCPSLGRLKSSLHICNHVDIHWLMKQYELKGLSQKPMVIIASSISDENITDRYPSVEFKQISKRHKNGRNESHNAKISVFIYEDNSLRVTCGSVNPYYSDWNGINQAIWVSPKCPTLLDSSCSGESITMFKNCLLEYLTQYKMYILSNFIEVIKKADFQRIRVFLVTCFPSVCTPERPNSYIRRVASILSSHVQPTWKIIICSSHLDRLTGLKKSDNGSYFRSYIMGSLCGNLNSISDGIEYGVMFPCVRDKFERGILYNRNTGLKKKYQYPEWMGPNMRNMMRLKLNGYGRSGAMLRPNLYYQISPCSTKLAYFVLTSVDLRRLSWGIEGTNNYISNRLASHIIVTQYEAGILFIPSYFEEEYFTIRNDLHQKNRKLFPMLTDPLHENYLEEDQLWCFAKQFYRKEEYS